MLNHVLNLVSLKPNTTSVSVADVLIFYRMTITFVKKISQNVEVEINIKVIEEF